MDDLKAGYDEVSPITGNFCVLVEADPESGTWNKMCMESGYVSFSLFKEGSEYVEDFEDGKLPEVAVSHRKVDDQGYVWYPAYIPTLSGTLFCIGNAQDFQWGVAEIKDIPEDTDMPTLEGNYEHYLDINNARIFPREEFEEAFGYLMELNIKAAQEQQ